MSAICLRGVSKSFGAVRAIDDISLDVVDGELLALLGPSGCGKTTFLRVVAGLERPTSGRILFDGRDVTDRPTRERPIGMVFQTYALFPNLTVRRNISFPLEVRHRPRAEIDSRVEELLDLVHLGAQAERFPTEISGGQAQRCALARALAPRPQVLLLDEPLSALDVVVRVRLRDEIRRIQRSVGTTTIYVTHDQSEALAIADRVGVMQHGRLEQVGAPRDVYGEPQTEFAATFVGSRNVVELDVRDGRAALGRLFEVTTRNGVAGRIVSYFAPESVEVGPIASGANGGQLATIEGLTFHGAITRLQLTALVDGRQIRLYADVPSRQAAPYEVGTDVSLHVDGRDVRCFPARDVSPARAL